MERAVQGVSAAPGGGCGVGVVRDRARPPARTAVAPAARGREVDRANAALQAAAHELQEIATRLREKGRDAEAEIVETGELMAADPALIELVQSLILASGLPADAALRQASDQIATELANLADPTLALRADDVRSLGRSAAARAIGGRMRASAGVLVAGTLGPADVAEVATRDMGVARAGGGVTAHAAIVARSLGMPMVVGLGADALDVEDGEEVVLDGDAGVLIRRPDPGRIAAARSMIEHRHTARRNAVARRLEPAETMDGHRLVVLANAASVAEVIEGAEQGAEGVGLLRTELGFLDASAWPSLAQHLAFLKPILGRLEGRTATVRLLDFGGDKTPPFLHGVESRGIALLLQAPQALRTQLAAIVEAGAGTKLRILIPRATTPDQVLPIHEMLADVLDGRPAPQAGSLIEPPEAALHAGEIADASHFLSIGTNDLTQLA